MIDATHCNGSTAQKRKFTMKNFISKYDQMQCFVLIIIIIIVIIITLIIMIINLFRLYKFTVALMHKRKYIYIVINYIYIIKLYEKKNTKRTAGTTVNFMG